MGERFDLGHEMEVLSTRRRGTYLKLFLWERETSMSQHREGGKEKKSLE